MPKRFTIWFTTWQYAKKKKYICLLVKRIYYDLQWNGIVCLFIDHINFDFTSKYYSKFIANSIEFIPMASILAGTLTHSIVYRHAFSYFYLQTNS